MSKSSTVNARGASPAMSSAGSGGFAVRGDTLTIQTEARRADRRHRSGVAVVRAAPPS
jgi:hypothetical protein